MLIDTVEAFVKLIEEQAFKYGEAILIDPTHEPFSFRQLFHAIESETTGLRTPDGFWRLNPAAVAPFGEKKFRPFEGQRRFGWLDDVERLIHKEVANAYHTGLQAKQDAWKARLAAVPTWWKRLK